MNAIIKQQADLIETQVDDELVIVSLVNGEFYSLKDTGLAIWQAIDGTRDEASLISTLASKCGAPEVEIAEDVQTFLSDLELNGFIKSR
ncbi:PqqD family protein [Altererythrobacter sp. ZODW24]|uniref:PqqD family protein n=1 Tax=Altererythrobacter sp. ZODW24 TaxID=2185142 RepID=UPI0013B3A739|nr:PqqD family protein [Altererythrobacter sp. ZODW24]